MGPYNANNYCYSKCYLGVNDCGGYTVTMRKPTFPGSLTDLHRFRKTAHGHDGSSRIVMVRKTDQRTFASIQNGQEPKLETITRETIETFRGERTECKITTETKDFEEKCPQDILEALADRAQHKTVKRTSLKRKNSKMDFQNECLKAHNEYRKKHGVPPLKLNKDISKFSQQWADNLIKKGILQHSSNKDYGENLYCIQSSNPNFTVTGKEAVDSWYDEIKVHTFGAEPKSLASGHFTQVIWKESKELGVAFARSGGKVVVVCNYYPAGNIIGHFDENVPPVGGSPTNTNNNHIPLINSLSKLSLFKGSSKPTEGNFEQDFLDAHNNYRKRHGAPPLKLDKKLSKYAEEWAKHLAVKNILEHRPGSNYGENIYCIYSSDATFAVNGNAPVDTWYEEIKDHPFGREPNSLKSGHFTQVVWKSSELLGVGVAKNPQGSIYVVANYSPAGNFVGHYVDNVPPVKPMFYDDDVLSNIMKKDKEEEQSEAVSPAVETSTGLFNQFAIDALKVHNEYRRKHGVPELKLSEKLCDFAQEWAATCARTSSLQHRANNPYGENIFCVYSSDYSHIPSARDAVKEWYDEIKLHTFGVEKVNQKSLHFTQLVWRNSKELGIGMAQNKKGQTYVVANYDPRGNYIGQFVENVPKPRP